MDRPAPGGDPPAAGPETRPAAESGPRIRGYRASDLDALLDVWEAASRLAHPFLDDAFLASERRAIAELHLPAAETWVCEIDGAVAGFIALADDEVGGLFVDPRHHRRGIGRSLVDHVLQRRESLHLDVFEENAIGRAFYERYGFRIVGTRRHDGTGRRLLVMRFEGHLEDST